MLWGHLETTMHSGFEYLRKMTDQATEIADSIATTSVCLMKFLLDFALLGKG